MSFGNNILNEIKILEITGDMKYFKYNLFSESSSLTLISILYSVTSIENNVCSGCPSLTQI